MTCDEEIKQRRLDKLEEEEANLLYTAKLLELLFEWAFTDLDLAPSEKSKIKDTLGNIYWRHAKAKRNVEWLKRRLSKNNE